MYINDLSNTSKLLSVHLFADDTNIYCSCKNLHDLELILNQELHSVAEWMKSNRLALSIFKTNFFLFYSKKLKPYKSLKNHVNELCLKLSKTVGIFSKLRYYVNVDILIMLYGSLIYPFLLMVFKFGVSHTQPT